MTIARKLMVLGICLSATLVLFAKSQEKDAKNKHRDTEQKDNNGATAENARDKRRDKKCPRDAPVSKGSKKEKRDPFTWPPVMPWFL